MTGTKMGGKGRLRLLVKANEDVTDSLTSIRDGGRKVERGLRELIEEQYQGRFSVEMRCEPCGQWDQTLQELEDLHSPADVAVLSALPDALLPAASERAADEIEETLARLVRVIHERCGAHVIAFNCSSVDPSDEVHNYHGVADTFAVRVHRLNLALMRVSQGEGISLIDVERVIAELGGRRHVERAGVYSSAAYQALGREFLRVLADIGFFESRPLVPQVGQKGKAAKTPDAGKGAS